ncbi:MULTISPECIES: fimbrial protein [Enterobacter]|jgi:P pilus assembly protein, pilin FimA|uniref:fimbrial protein n=1 Tax=Enterobacter TaxID=547 RepID=UPI000DCC79E2|nr:MULTISPECIES: fimbrial protein [Enterobacter]KAA0512258.1 fimbrial protein [Enterobacter vonholyi]MCL5635725.1 fimbrial protein [Enterobacter vonholyi]RAY82440.1 type 1 fimbrial protein [Enterobacter cloacae]UAN29967.1 fimbrial protein [Enterobacter sp. JBIWA005]
MNAKNKLLVMALSSLITAGAHAATDQGHGKITFLGSVIDAPCSIDAKSLDQTIQLGAISKNQLADGGKSTPVSFDIQLHDCDSATANKASITFNGIAGAKTDGLDSAFAVTGQASGVGVGITDMGGKVIKPGTKSSLSAMSDGDNELQFLAYVQGSTASGAVIPGNFTSIANFMMTYE